MRKSKGTARESGQGSGWESAPEGAGPGQLALEGSGAEGAALDRSARKLESYYGTSEAAEESGPVSSVRVRRLVKRFGEQVAVAGIDLELPAGRFIGLVGPNGAGKTTTLSMVTGLLRPDDGMVRIVGHDVWSDPVGVKSRIGVLPEGLRLFERLTGRELPTFTGRLRGLPADDVDKRAIQLLDVLGMDNSAFWTVSATIATRRDAELELRGRALMVASVAVPYVAVVTTGTALLLGRVSALPETLGMAFALLGALIATGGYASVRFPYAVQRDNPFAGAAPGHGGLVAFNVLGGTLTGSALCLPVLGLTVALHLTGHHALLWIVLPIGAVTVSRWRRPPCGSPRPGCSTGSRKYSAPSPRGEGGALWASGGGGRAQACQRKVVIRASKSSVSARANSPSGSPSPVVEKLTATQRPSSPGTGRT